MGVIEEIEHDRLWDYVNGELDAVERGRFLAHAGRCGPCRRDLEEHEWIAEALHWDELEEPPATLRAGLLREYHVLYRPPRGAGLASRLQAVPGWVVAAATVLLIGAAILSVTGRGGGRPQRAPSAAGGLEVAVAPAGDGIAYQVYFPDGTVKSVQQAAVPEEP